ncbi:hypothetical protein [Cerasicoccus maritimus]|uniref:hypothetical protein n=1 Tax=Cerasicoccus maritimus TaxID=490089 RepID=UPI00285293FD|nr:hypothetical protein [Cerasicoccus maritimus]
MLKFTRQVSSDELVVVFLNTATRHNQRYFRALGLERRNCVRVFDPSGCQSLAGMRPEFLDFASVLARLREIVSTVQPRRLLVCGASTSGFPALLYGSLLQADDVIAIAPYTSFAPGEMCLPEAEKKVWAKRVRLLLFKFPDFPEAYLDLGKVLAEGNGKTRYAIHVGGGCERDVVDAGRLAGLPGVRIHTHPYQYHSLDQYLLMSGQLRAVHCPGYEVPSGVRKRVARLRAGLSFRWQRMRIA